jgi:hypothetical protein
MKKILTILTILLTCNNLYSQVFGSASLGYLDKNTIDLYLKNNSQAINSNLKDYPIYTAIELGYKYKSLKIYQLTETIVKPKEWWNYTPYTVNYEIGLICEYKFIELRVNHWCLHPVITRYNETTVNIKGGGNRFIVKFKF